MTFGETLVWLAVVLAAASIAWPRRRLVLAAAVALWLAVVRLAVAFVGQDWTLTYVVDHARSGVGPLFRLSGVWAGAEGSLLLWTAMVATAAVVAARSAPEAVRFGGGLVAAYGLVVALTASPFGTADLPAVDGLGLQPVLEHPAMIWHPPILYAGLVGLLVPALLALAGAGERVGSSLCTAMAILTVGLVTGAVWANVELGWGGFWAWDPVESAGLVAWLLGAGALHLRPGLVGARVAAAALVAPGVAALWATTLTRIGVVSSVHAFADRPALRLGLLVVAGGATVIAVGRVAAARPGSAQGSTDRRLALAAMAAAAVFTAVGTYEPVVEWAFGGDAVAIAGHYYTRLLWPTAIVGIALAVRADRAWWPAAAGAAVGLGVTPLAAGPFALALAAGGGAVAGSALARLVTRRPGALAHAGVGLVLVGTAGTVATATETITVASGQTETVGGMDVRHDTLILETDSATNRAIATVTVDGAQLEPALVSYRLRGVATAEMARRFDGLDEVQVLLLDGDAESARYRITRLRRVGLVWIGAAITALGLFGRFWRWSDPHRGSLHRQNVSDRSMAAERPR